jgi:hypothetical protein
MKTSLITCLWLLCTTVASAQEKPLKNGLALGYGVGQYGKDFVVQLNVSSPFFAAQNMGIRFRGNLAFNEHPDAAGETVWTPYGNLSLGLVGVGGMVGESIRLYGEGGALCLLPSTQFSKEAVVPGGYGLFGFEFFMTRNANYYIEIGGAGSGAVADKIPGRPIYSNGLLINVGFRITL